MKKRLMNLLKKERKKRQDPLFYWAFAIFYHYSYKNQFTENQIISFLNVKKQLC